jgi:hypothetical protein
MIPQIGPILGPQRGIMLQAALQHSREDNSNAGFSTAGRFFVNHRCSSLEFGQDCSIFLSPYFSQQTTIRNHGSLVIGVGNLRITLTASRIGRFPDYSTGQFNGSCGLMIGRCDGLSFGGGPSNLKFAADQDVAIVPSTFAKCLLTGRIDFETAQYFKQIGRAHV